MTSASPQRAWLLLVALMALAVVAYWPSLRGGYLFDDGIYYAQNPDIHVDSLQPGEWMRAATSQCSINLLCRPLSALTFAANWYFTGIDPFWPKLTNLAIHLCNGLLLFALLRELFRLNATVRSSSANKNLVAAAIAGAWLLLPINLTGVAYVSQRMEALANLFVFLGLWWYLHARRRQWVDQGKGAMLWISIAACTALGLTAKEDAALLPLFTACAEFAVTGFRNRDGRWCKPAIRVHLALLVVPMIAGLVWIAPRLFHGVSGYRNFTTWQRLLTEARVLCDYIGWTLLPNLNSLTFYHDDLPLSRGLLDPPTTLLAILALLALLGSALWQRKARPLFCLGIAWFFAGHSMTATIIPLELVFEHRNYFPSAGLLLAAASLIALEPGLRLPLARTLLATGFIAFFAFTTLLRAEEWSNPVRLAYAEALKRPHSQRAQYDLARTLIIAAGKDETSPLLDEAAKILERNAYQPDSGITALQALIYINGRAHRAIDPRWWQAIVEKLHNRAPSQSDIAAIIFLFKCQQDGDCPLQRQQLLDTFVAGLQRSEGNLNLMSAYADFALRELHDVALAERVSREVVATAPANPVYRENLIRLLVSTRQFDKIAPEMDALQKLNRLGALDKDIATLQAQAAAAQAEPIPGTPSTR
ncbi:MAG: hypothetical protein JSS28_11660 [Proteobacteria bacterium]|nr:hypothetical protein [Pseudomonadota bacterium]